MNSRKVTEKKNNKLKLECGHTVPWTNEEPPPESVPCEECVALLERCRQKGDWFLSKKVKGLHAALRLMEKEGLVKSSRAPYGVTIFWHVT